MQEITIHNFRCYKDKSISFRPGINLLIGDNAAGKTSLLTACNFVMNAFFAGFSDENTIWRSVGKEDFRVSLAKDNIILPEEPISISFRPNEKDFPTILDAKGKTVLKALSNAQEQRIEKKSKKNSRNLIEGLKELKTYGATLQQHSHSLARQAIIQNNALPLYAYFSTEDIHTSRKIDRERFREYNQKPSFGYYECYDCKGLFSYWTERLLVLSEAGTGATEIETVKAAIKKCLGNEGCDIIEELIIRPQKGSLFFRYTDGRIVEGSLLSDGYRRLVNIVIDIAFRCALLNQVKYGIDSYRHTHGTVIIDEIDEHLHPSLQVRILGALQNTFPQLQFIVSTHAPLVISSVELCPENVVYQLEYAPQNDQYTHHELSTYGLDASTILEVYMGQASRDLKIDTAIKDLFDTIEQEDFTAARQKIDQLSQQIASANPELTRAEALLSFLEFNDAEDN